MNRYNQVRSHFRDQRQVNVRVEMLDFSSKKKILDLICSARPDLLAKSVILAEDGLFPRPTFICKIAAIWIVNPGKKASGA